MRTDRTVISDRAADKDEQWLSRHEAIVDRMTDACENSTLPCGR